RRFCLLPPAGDHGEGEDRLRSRRDQAVGRRREGLGGRRHAEGHEASGKGAGEEEARRVRLLHRRREGAQPGRSGRVPESGRLTPRKERPGHKSVYEPKWSPRLARSRAASAQLSVENSWKVARIGRNAAYTAEVFRPCRGGFDYICATAARAPRRPPQSPCPLVKER